VAVAHSTLTLLPRAALPRYLTQEEVTRFFAVISSPHDRALFALIYHYGLRVEEATLLTLEDVNLKDLHIRVHRLKHGVSTQKPLWRHNAKLLRSYLRVRQDAGYCLFTGRQGPLQETPNPNALCRLCQEGGH
jgi:integrase